MKTENKEHDAVSSINSQEGASPRVVDRREFLGTAVGAAVLGASVIGGASSAMAQDIVIPTPDWKTLSPGEQNSDLYTEHSGYNDQDVTSWAGRNVFDLAEPRCDITVHLVLMIVIICQGGVNLRGYQVGMLPLNFVGVPVMGHTIQGHFHNLGFRSGDHRNSVFGGLNVRVRFSRHANLRPACR